MQRQGKTRGLPVCLHVNWCEAQLCLNKDLLAGALISHNESYWSTTLDVQCAESHSKVFQAKYSWSFTTPWGIHSTHHTSRLAPLSLAPTSKLCAPFYSMHRPCMAGRGTASHIVGKNHGARRQLEICSLLWSLPHISLIPTAEQDHTSELI